MASTGSRLLALHCMMPCCAALHTPGLSGLLCCHSSHANLHIHASLLQQLNFRGLLRGRSHLPPYGMSFVKPRVGKVLDLCQSCQQFAQRMIDCHKPRVGRMLDLFQSCRWFAQRLIDCQLFVAFYSFLRYSAQQSGGCCVLPVCKSLSLWPCY